MDMKTRLLILGITMNPAGTEKSFLSFASMLDYEKYDVTLLLAKKDGLLLSMLPKEIRVIGMPEYGELFTMNGGNAPSAILKTVAKKHPSVLFDIIGYIFSGKTQTGGAMELWYRLSRYFPDVPGEYDAAIAFWGDKTMFYMLDHVNAKKKITWLHFDYEHPQRSDSLYGPAFARCDRIVTVSKANEEGLRKKFPELSPKITTIENIMDPALIRNMALRGETFPDRHFTGKRILTVGRIAEQKGYDMAVSVLARLRADGLNVRWYVIGDGPEENLRRLKEQAITENVADMLILLGKTENPYTYMRDCDLYVQPSRHEGKPIAVEEAKILYKPILVTEYASAREQLADGRFGMITEISVDGIYHGLKTMLEDGDLCDRYSEELIGETRGNTSEISKFYEILWEDIV